MDISSVLANVTSGGKNPGPGGTLEKTRVVASMDAGCLRLCIPLAEPIDVQQATALKLQVEAKASYELHPICRLVLPPACRPYLLAPVLMAQL